MLPQTWITGYWPSTVGPSIVETQTKQIKEIHLFTFPLFLVSCLGSDWLMTRLQHLSQQNWRPQLNQSATALVPPRIMGCSPRPISTLQEVTSEDEDRERHQEVPRVGSPHCLSPQPAPRQRSFSCTQHALQRRSNAHQPEPNYVVVTDTAAAAPTERAVISSSTHQPATGDASSRAHQAPSSKMLDPRSRIERSNNSADSTQTAL